MFCSWKEGGGFYHEKESFEVYSRIKSLLGCILVYSSVAVLQLIVYCSQYRVCQNNYTFHRNVVTNAALFYVNYYFINLLSSAGCSPAC